MQIKLVCLNRRHTWQQPAAGSHNAGSTASPRNGFSAFYDVSAAASLVADVGTVKKRLLRIHATDVCTGTSIGASDVNNRVLPNSSTGALDPRTVDDIFSGRCSAAPRLGHPASSDAVSLRCSFQEDPASRAKQKLKLKCYIRVRTQFNAVCTFDAMSVLKCNRYVSCTH